MDLLLSTSGRINRKQFWIGFLILFVIALLLLLPVASMQTGGGSLGQWISLVISVFMLYPAIAISTKRLRDRGRHPIALWLIAYFAPGVITNLAQTLKIGFQTIDLGGIQISTPNFFGSVLIFIGLISFIAAVIDLGFMKGAHTE